MTHAVLVCRKSDTASFIHVDLPSSPTMLVRRAVPLLAAVYVPTSVLAGFLILLAGPLIPDEIVPVLDTVVVRPDPVPAAA